MNHLFNIMGLHHQDHSVRKKGRGGTGSRMELGVKVVIFTLTTSLAEVISRQICGELDGAALLDLPRITSAPLKFIFLIFK